MSVMVFVARHTKGASMTQDPFKVSPVVVSYPRHAQHFQNASSHVDIPLKRALQVSGDKSSPSEES